MSTELTNKLLTRKVTERTKIFDTKLSGLYASVTPSKVTFCYKFYDGHAKKQVTIQVGVFDPDRFNVDGARKKVRILIGERLQGVDIKRKIEVATVAAEKGALTFNEVADKWIAWMQVPEEKAHGIAPRCESWSGYHYALSRPRAAFGKKRIADVTDDDIAGLLSGILDERGRNGASLTGSANNARRTLSAFFNWARLPGRKYVPFNPCANLGKKPKRPSKTRTLSDDEIRTLWHGLDRPDLPCDRHTALCLKLILCTGLRPSEVGLSLRSELHNLDGTTPELHVDASRVKLRRPVYQPLNNLAREIVLELLSDGVEAGPLFYGNKRRYTSRPGATLNAWALARALAGETHQKKRKGREADVGIIKFLGLAKFTPHDLRRTAATLLGKAGVSDGAIAQVLDHQKKPGQGATTSTLIYNQANENLRAATLATLDGILRKIIGNKPGVVKLRSAA
jgi:integrase